MLCKMLSVKSMDNLGLLWKDWRSRVQACELEGEAARSGGGELNFVLFVFGSFLTKLLLDSDIYLSIFLFF